MKMTEAQRQEIRSRYEAIRWTLNERMHRLWAATEAKVLGHGGVTALSEITGLSRIVTNEGSRSWRNRRFRIRNRERGGSDDPELVPSL